MATTILNEEFTIDDIHQKLYNSKELFEAISKYGLTEVSSPAKYSEYDISVLKRIAEIVYKDLSDILNRAIPDLILNKYLFRDISVLFGYETLPEPVFHTIFYVIKHASIKTFFIKNYRYFMPEYDYYEIQNKEKVKIYVESFIKEFDRFTDVIEKLYNFTDIDKIPNEYLSYLSSLIGYERDDNYIKDNEFYRALLKNMVEVYKIKGTNYSIELFLSFLGFNINISEYWFDRRYFYSTSGKNPYTGETNKNSYSFYLTPTKPTKTIPDESTYKVTVNANDFCTQKNLYSFDKLIDQSKATAEQLLGFDKTYSGETYTYFKTNVASYNVERIIASKSSVVEEITSLDIEMIKKYVTFLTPIFVQNNIVIISEPYETEYIKEDDGTETNVARMGYKDKITFEEINYTLANLMSAFFTENKSELFSLLLETKIHNEIKPRLRTIRDIYNLSATFGSTKVRSKVSLYGRTQVDAKTYYGMSWERADYGKDIYEYMSDAIFVKYENTSI